MLFGPDEVTTLSSASANYFRLKYFTRDILSRWCTIPKETMWKANNNTDRDVSQSCPSAPTVCAWEVCRASSSESVQKLTAMLNHSDGLHRPSPYLLLKNEKRGFPSACFNRETSHSANILGKALTVTGQTLWPPVREEQVQNLASYSS